MISGDERPLMAADSPLRKPTKLYASGPDYGSPRAQGDHVAILATVSRIPRSSDSRDVVRADARVRQRGDTAA